MPATSADPFSARATFDTGSGPATLHRASGTVAQFALPAALVTGKYVLSIPATGIADAGTPAVDDLMAITLLAAAGIGPFTVNATDLKASTAYRFRAFVKTSRGIAYSDVGTFTTPAA